MLHFSGLQKPKKAKRKPIWFVAVDELDEVPVSLGDQGDPLEMLSERQRTFEPLGARTIYGTTPTTERGHAATRWGAKWDHRRHYVPCPRCGAFGVMATRPDPWHGPTPLHLLRYTRGITPEKLESAGGAEHVWLQCWRCKGRVHSHEKPAMVSAGRWLSAVVDQEADGGERGETIDDDGRIHTISTDGEEVVFELGEDPDAGDERLPHQVCLRMAQLLRLALAHAPGDRRQAQARGS